MTAAPETEDVPEAADSAGAESADEMFDRIREETSEAEETADEDA